jgi:hypothetical protein
MRVAGKPNPAKWRENHMWTRTGSKSMEPEYLMDGSGQIATYVKPALMDRPAMKLLPASETVASAVESFKNNPKGPDGVEVAVQLSREMAGQFNYLAAKAGGLVEIVDGTTKLRDIAIAKEIRTPRGLDNILAAAIYVQSYMPVGRCSWLTGRS